MIRDITIGQYYPAKSPLHAMDARVKIMLTILFVISIFLVNTFVGYFLVALALGIVIRLSQVPFRFMLKGLKSIFIIIVFTAIINLFMVKGEHILVSIGFLTVTREGLVMAVQMCIRLVLLILGASVLTLCTTPIQLTDGIETLLRPLKKIGVPSHEIAMMMTIALRFVPTLLDETDKIMKAQQARGADFETGSLMQRAKSLIPILVPLFISAFRRADELAMAMEARCYHGGDNRTRMHVSRLHKVDYVAQISMAVYVLLLIGLRVAAERVPFLL